MVLISHSVVQGQLTAESEIVLRKIPLMRGVRLLAAIGGGLVVLAVAARMLRIDELEGALRVLGAQFTKDRGE